ncbi:hypothetical protein ACCI51_18180 [Microbulbifer echini]|uniref:Uncharacterized protein n=1 Tax=Microbulbifer echini TaxID=1529067 RepID=A0ABV4NT62_9GAMM
MIHLSSNAPRGFYTLKKTDSSGRSTSLSFENLITDIGLNKLGTMSADDIVRNFYVGSGSATPAFTDTNMNSLVGASSSIQSDSEGTQIEVAPYYVYLKKTVRFAVGAAAGNLSEVGVGWESDPSGSLFSRALIRDADGNPTSLTVLNDEYLDVTYELRIYPETSDVTGVVAIGGKDYQYIARPGNLASTNTDGWSLGRSNTSVSKPWAYDGSLGAVTGLPSGNADDGAGAAVPYTSNSLQASVQQMWGLNDGNLGGVRSIRVYMGWSCWQLQFSNTSDGSAIPKDTSNVLSFVLTHSWARG